DKKQVLYATNYIKQWRHSYYAKYWVYDIATKKVTQLTKDSGKSDISYATWSPSGSHLSFVRSNDLYVTDLKKEVRVTKDGTATIFNGVPDWVYEEEVFSNNYAHWWSPGSKAIAFLRLDETTVPEFRMPLNHPGNMSDSYPSEVVIKYPKAGYPNPIVSLHIHHLNSESEPLAVKFPKTNGLNPSEMIIGEVKWLTKKNDFLLVRVSNRIQNKQWVFIVDAKLGTAKLTRHEEATDGGWLDWLQPVSYIPPNKATGVQKGGYIDIVEHSGYKHLALYTPITAKKPVYLTRGQWEVNNILGVDSVRGNVYFTSTEIDSTEPHVFSVNFGGKKKQLSPNTKGGAYSATFSNNKGYYILKFLGPQIPWSKLYSIDDPKFERVLEDNAGLQKILAGYEISSRRYKKITVGGVELNTMEILPPGFKESERKKYNVLFHVYGGPNSNYVTRNFRLGFDDFLTAAPWSNTIIVKVDGRGTAFKGRKFRSPVCRRLGQYETIDQVNAGKYWKQLPYVNSTNVAIWGWSYGGYMTGKVLEADSQVFSTGISVAPVTDWKLYDSVYTERFMSTPQDNPEGYEASKIRNMTGFHHANYLLIHGTGDDNVHFQNSLNLVDTLTAAKVHRYRFQAFTDSDHSINIRNATEGIYFRIVTYLADKFHLFKTDDIDVKMEEVLYGIKH
ncbi:Dipeptidyl peptidase 4, partial [Basidiobolus ranarum]